MFANIVKGDYYLQEVHPSQWKKSAPT